MSSIHTVPGLPTEQFAQSVVDTLNRALETDPAHIRDLIATHVPCNEVLAYDRTIQVGKTGEGYEIGLLGIINGIVQDIRPDFTIVTDSEVYEQVTEFRLVKPSELKKV